MDVQALDTGRHRAMVVVDPQDRRKLKGFLYMSGIYSPSIERAEESVRAENIQVRFYHQMPRQMVERRMLQGLADKMTAPDAGQRRSTRRSSARRSATFASPFHPSDRQYPL